MTEPKPSPLNDDSGEPQESNSWPPLEAVTGEWALGDDGVPLAVDDESLGFEVKSEVDPAPMPQVIGDYVIEQLIGSGGMGRVYLARHRTMDRIVAIKTLPQEQSLRSSAIERFYEEVRTAGKLLHPNIATAFDAGCSEGVHYWRWNICLEAH